MFMEITEHTVGDVTVLHLKGRMVLEEGEIPFQTVMDTLVQQGRLKVVLDLQDVSYIDSAGLGILVSKYISVHRRGGNIKLLHLTERSSHVLEITKLTCVFDSFDSESEAVRSFDAVKGLGVLS
jgi:anti-sigma B factor antagonist